MNLSTGRKVALSLLLLLVLMIVVGMVAPKQPQNSEYKPQNEFKLDPWIKIKIGSLDLSINKAVLYLVQWAVRELLMRRARRAEDPRAVVGVLAASMVGRGMASGLALLVVGLTSSRHTGLAAVLLFLAAFTVAFMVGMALRPFERSTP